MKKSTIFIVSVVFLFFGLTTIAQKNTHEKKRGILKKTNHTYLNSKKNDLSKRIKFEDDFKPYTK